MKRITCMALLLWTAACGSISDGSFRGVPRHLLRGRMQGTLPDAALVRPNLAVIWGRAGPYGTSLASETSPIEPRLGDFEVAFFHEPPKSLFLNRSGLEAVAGVYAAFEDVDDNHELDVPSGIPRPGSSVKPDRIFGYSPTDFIFAVRSIPSPWNDSERTAFVNPDALRVGWNVLRLCAAQPGHLPAVQALVLAPEDAPVLEAITPTSDVTFQVALFDNGASPTTLLRCPP